MSENTFNDILYRAESELTPEQQRRLAETLVQRDGVKRNGRHRIVDLEGLGAEVWQNNGMTADEYVAQERNAWDG